MFSAIKQEKTNLRDGRGMTVYRRLYLLDRSDELPTLPTTDAPGSGAMTAEGDLFLLDHSGTWHVVGDASHVLGAMGGGLWNS